MKRRFARGHPGRAGRSSPAVCGAPQGHPFLIRLFLTIAIGLAAIHGLCRTAIATDGPAPRNTGAPAPYRSRPLTLPLSGQTGFTRLPPEITGVFYTNQVTPEGLARNQILELGSGVALGDIDADGWVDLYFCSLERSNRLYRNLGNWTFSDVTAVAGVACPASFSTGAVFADVDGDSDLDLLVNSLRGGTRLFLNDGRGRFTERHDAGLQHPHGSTTLALADTDGDGWLDLYVATYRTNTIKDAMRELDVHVNPVTGELVVSPPNRFVPLALKGGGVSLFEIGEPDLFLKNRGGQEFAPLSWTHGTFLDPAGRPLASAPQGWGLTVAFRDLNGDLAPDIYVCNDFFHSLDEIWINDGSGRFSPLAPTAMRHTSMSSMAVDFADLNRDGCDEILVTDMLSREHQQRHRQRGSQIHLRMDLPVSDPLYRPEYPRNTLFLNRGDGTYAEIAQFSGIEASEWTWSVAFIDVDLDGYEDALITTGNLRDANDADLSRGQSGRMESRFSGNLRFPRLSTPTLAFRNQHDLTFRECGEAWGFHTIGVSQAMALADLDNDGDLDVVVPTVDQPVGLYRNDSIAPRIAVRLHGAPPNTQGVGSKVIVRSPGLVQSQEVMCGGRYLSGDDPRRVFAALTNAGATSIEVRWRSGRKTVIDDVRPNHLYDVFEPTNYPPAGTRTSSASLDQASPSPLSSETQIARSEPARRPLFADVSALLKQPHRDPPYAEWERQPSLTRSLSQLGPGVTWFDVDDNGTEDLLVGSGRDGFQMLYLNDGRGSFHAMRPKNKASGDQTTSLAWHEGPRQAVLLIGTSQYEAAALTGVAVMVQNPRTGAENALTRMPASVGPLALTVRDGSPLLFVGGRVVPGRYPMPASSQLLVYRSGEWQVDAANTSRLRDVGLISGAVWSDLDGDAEPDLALACEWGPIRVLRFTGGVLQDVTERLGLGQYRGWWNGVATGDFDNDGRMDLVAGNWGRNTRYQRFLGRPVRVYSGEWRGAGAVDLLESYYEETLGKYVPFQTLDRLREQLPAIAHKFTTFAAYAQAGIEDVLGDAAASASILEANWPESTVFLNRGDHFEAFPLPDDAQLAPAFGVAVGDLDGDGCDDVVLSQNFFGVEPETTRLDAGRGLLLQGNGHGGFRAVSGAESGIILYGEQRGCALGDFDQDGRPDVAMAQNNGPIGLFHNTGGVPGLRVRLRGPTDNPDGLGAMVRLKYGDRFGPARLVQAGSGYWSQDSLTLILGQASSPTAVWVRWPGGLISTVPVPEGTREITVSAVGASSQRDRN